MLIGLFGTPSPLSYWTLAALRSTVEVCRTNCRIVETSSLEDLRQALATREGQTLIYFCDCPEAGVAKIFLESGAPYLMCLEPPSEVLGFCLKERKMRPVDALRFTAQSFSALHDLALGPKARVLARNPDRSLSQTVIDFCAAYHLTKDAKLAAEAVRRLAGGSDLVDVSVEGLVQAISANARPIGGYAAGLGELGVPPWMVDVANQFSPILEKRAIGQMLWPRQAFLDPRGPEEAVLSKQELFGPSRHLVFGPFLHLPRGSWRASVSIQMAGVRSSSMRADVAIMGVPAEIVRFNLPTRGKFEFSLDFDVTEPRQFIEVRIELLSGEIEGQFSFGGVELQRLANAA